MAHAILVIVEEIGLGLVTGVVLAALAAWFRRITSRRGWTSEHWLHVPVVALGTEASPRRRRSAAAALSHALSVASIVFAVIVFDAGVPGKETLAVTTAVAVLLSVVAHGASANPLIARLGFRDRR